MNSQPNPAATHARRSWWPSAATCAFLASGVSLVGGGRHLQETRYFVLVQWQRGMMESAGSQQLFDSGYDLAILAYIFLFLFGLGLAVEAGALWGIGRRQRTFAPLSSRWGQWAAAAYVVASTLTFVLIILMDAGVFLSWPTVSTYAGRFFAAKRWISEAPLIPLTLAFGCFGWASRSASGLRGRWAARGMLTVAAWTTISIVWTMFSFPAGQGWPWLAPIRSLAGRLTDAEIILRAATWIAVGAWLRSPNDSAAIR